MGIRQDIQFLRGLAVTLVVLFHLQIPSFENGFLGVDVFFVISGFLMAKLYSNGSFLDFYKRRIDRLYPPYITTLFATIFAGAFLAIPVDFNQLFDQSLAGLFFVSNVFYWNQNSYFDKAAFNPLLNLWSLAVEVQFYLVVPVLYPLLKRKKWLFAAVFVGSLIACLAIQTVSPKTSFFLMPLRIWEFLIGASVAWWGASKSGDSSKTDRASSLVYVFSLIVCIFTFTIKPDSTGAFSSGHPALPALTVSILTALVIKNSISHRILDNFAGRLITKIGDYSYSIYLVHFPIIVLLNYIPFGGTRLSFDDNFRLLAAAATITLASVTSYHYVERNIAGKLNMTSFRLSALALFLISAWVLTNLNLSQYSALQKNIFSAWTDRDTYRCGKIFRVMHPTDAVCTIWEGTGNRNLLLLGNSHADSIKKVFARKAAEYNVSTYFAVSNEPLLNSGPNAEIFIAESLERNIQVIVLHYSNIYRNKKSAEQVEKLIRLAIDKHIKVVLIAPVPTYDVSIPKAMFERAGGYDSFRTTRTLHLERTKEFWELAERLKDLGVVVYDPSEALCGSDDVCVFSTEDLKPYYFDSGHLTLSGALKLSPLFERLLKNL